MTVTAVPAEGTRSQRDGPGPLAGVRVVDLGMLFAGPFTGRLLGDMGAEIIKVEPPGKPDPMREWGKARYQGRSLWWPVQSRNKKCVTLNLRQERGQQLLLDLVSHSDVLVENFRPGTLEKWGLGPDELWGGEPRARHCAHLRLRPDGAPRPAGRLRLRGGGDGRHPSHQRVSGRVAASAPDLARRLARRHVRRAGHPRRALLAGVLGGGRGQVVDVSPMEGCFALLESAVPEYDRLGIVRGPGGTGLKGVAPSNIFSRATARGW
jgi:formyl-CoA transferase